MLEGEFGDEHQTYPVGTYVRNPIGTSHAPRVGDEGCVILVKLHQFDKDDTAQVVIDTRDPDLPSESVAGLTATCLHQFQEERVILVRWEANTPFKEHTHHGGEEVFVIEGSFSDEYGDYPAGSWVRYPDQSSHSAFTREEGALLFLKTGHLPATD